MAINTYATLQTAVLDFLNRADLASAFPNFVTLAEAEMRSDTRLRSPAAVLRDTLVISSQYTDLPADFQEFLSVETTEQPYRRPECVTPATIDALRRGYSVPGVPTCARYYTIVGTELEVFPVPSAAETWAIAYYAVPGSLTENDDGSSTNWLLTDQPGLYLYATLKQTAPYLKEDERIGTWGAEYNRLADAYKASNDNKRFNASPVRVRTRTLG